MPAWSSESVSCQSRGVRLPDVALATVVSVDVVRVYPPAVVALHGVVGGSAAYGSVGSPRPFLHVKFSLTVAW